MPNYNYRCKECGHIKIFTACMNQIVLKENYCPSCKVGVSTFIRTFSPSTNFILKGKGWAKDNYNKKKEEK